MIFVRVAADFDQSASLAGVSVIGRAAWLWLIRRAKLASRGGALSAHYLDPDVILEGIRGAESDRLRLLADLATMHRRGLWTDTEDGEIVIKNWREYQIDLTVSERVAAHRRRKRVTECNGYISHVTDETGSRVEGEERESRDHGDSVNLPDSGERLKSDTVCPETAAAVPAPAPDRSMRKSRSKTTTDESTLSGRAVDALRALRAARCPYTGRGVVSHAEASRDPAGLAARLAGPSYPLVHVSEIHRAADWIAANPSRAKSSADRFLISWFGRAQDRLARVSAQAQTSYDARGCLSRPLPPSHEVRPLPEDNAPSVSIHEAVERGLVDLSTPGGQLLASVFGASEISRHEKPIARNCESDCALTDDEIAELRSASRNGAENVTSDSPEKVAEILQREFEKR